MEIRLGYCPKCGDELYDYTDEHKDGETVVFDFNCDCGFVGCEVMNVSFSHYTDDKGCVIE